MERFTIDEMKSVRGGDGVNIILLEGFMDGEKGNEHMYIFGIKIF